MVRTQGRAAANERRTRERRRARLACAPWMDGMRMARRDLATPTASRMASYRIALYRIVFVFEGIVIGGYLSLGRGRDRRDSEQHAYLALACTMLSR